MRTALLSLLTAFLLSSSAAMAQPQNPQAAAVTAPHYDWING